MSRRLMAWIFIVLAVLALIIGVSALWNEMWSWLPWSAESKLARTEQARDYAVADADARGLEVVGERDQAQRVETFHTQEVVIRDLTHQTITEARSAPDANDPIDAERADRLRAGDDRLCVQTGLCATPAAASVDP